MKSLFFALSVLLVFASCQKEITGEIITSSESAGSTGSTNSTSGNMQAKIDGTLWVANKGAGASFSTAANGLPALLNISGVSTDNKIFTITVVDSGVHVYTLNDNVMAAGAFIDSSSSNPFAFATNQGPAGVTAGTVSVTSIDKVKKTISGTFSFKVYRQMDSTQKTITEGSFTDLPYVDGSNVLPPAAATDTFTVKIDGTLFKPVHISGTALPIMNTLSIQGSDSLVVKTVAVNFPTNTPPGTYTLDLFGGTYIGQYNDGTNSLGSSSGTLEIIEHNTTTKRIRGKFSFKADYLLNPAITAQLSEGYFSVKYQ